MKTYLFFVISLSGVLTAAQYVESTIGLGILLGIWGGIVGVVYYVNGYDRGYADMLGKVTEKLQEMSVKNN